VLLGGLLCLLVRAEFGLLGLLDRRGQTYAVKGSLEEGEGRYVYSRGRRVVLRRVSKETRSLQRSSIVGSSSSSSDSSSVRPKLPSLIVLSRKYIMWQRSSRRSVNRVV